MPLIVSAKAAHIDVRDMPVGSRVVDPATGRVFVVPKWPHQWVGRYPRFGAW